jgi:hypothetical protein
VDGKYADVVFSGGLIHGQYIQSGTCYPVPGGGSLASGNVQSGHIGNGAVVSGSIASGQISMMHTVSGTIYGVNTGGSLASGGVQSGHVASGAVQGAAGSTRHIASGTLGHFDFGSGAVQSGDIASGQVGYMHLPQAPAGTIFGRATNISAGQHDDIAAVADSILLGNTNGAVVFATSGGVFADHLMSGSVISGKIASGNVGRMHLASGAVNSGHINTTGTPDGTKFLRDDLVWAAPTASLGSGTDVEYNRQGFWATTVELISGAKAVSWASGGSPRIQRANVLSGWRSPAIGVTMSGTVSGGSCFVVTQGPVTYAASGAIVSGDHGAQLFAGSGGLIIPASGNYHGGASSGGGARSTVVSGRVVMGLGQAISGGIHVAVTPAVFSLSGLPIGRIGFVV